MEYEEIDSKKKNLYKKMTPKGKIKLENVNDLIKIPINDLLSIDVNKIKGKLYNKIYEEALNQEKQKIQNKNKITNENNIKRRINKNDDRNLRNRFNNNKSIRQKSYDRTKSRENESSTSSNEEEEDEEEEEIDIKTPKNNSKRGSLIYQSDNKMNNFNKSYNSNFYSDSNIIKKFTFDNRNKDLVINYTPFKKKNEEGYFNNLNTNNFLENSMNKDNFYKSSNSNTISNNINDYNNIYNIENSQTVRRFYSGTINYKNGLNLNLIKKINFVISYISTYGEEVGVLGSIPVLGNWDENRVFKLKWFNGHIWKGGIYSSMEGIKFFEFKFVILQGNQIKKWETGDNNKFFYDMFNNQVKNRKNGFYDKYTYEFNPNNGELTLNCKWEN